MIQDVDRTIEALLKLELGNPLPFDLSFAIPDDEFTPISNARPTLNCYLYDIRENRDLRELDSRMQRTVDGTMRSEPAPTRVQVSYCITAWSPVQAAGGISPISDEHQLLGKVLRVLIRHPELPDAILLGSLIGSAPLPSTTIIIADPLKRAGEFWSAIQGKLRPSLDYAVTFPMPALDPFEGPIVVSITTGIASGPGIGEIVGSGIPIAIAGVLVQTNTVPPVPIPDAWVRIVETGRAYITNGDGGFVSDRLADGVYTLVARAIGFKEGSALLHVPNQTGPVTILLDAL